jgi:hypothetical protein
MSNYGPALVLTAGTLTFGNEWLQTGKLNWRVPVATLLGAGVMAAIGVVSTGAANGLAVMVLIAAANTEFNGKSAVQEISSSLPQQKR